MTGRTHQLDKIHDALQDRGYKPVTTYQQAVTAPGRDGRIEHWSGPKGDRLVQVGLEHGVVTSVEVMPRWSRAAAWKRPCGRSDGDVQRGTD